MVDGDGEDSGYAALDERTMTRMTGQVTPRQQRHPALLERAACLRAILDSIEANVFVADLSFQLLYANRRALRTAGSLDGELRAAFGVGAAQLLFGSIHRFHKDPARIERILRNPQSFPRQAVFTFGEVTLSTNINAVTDDTGEIIGYCVAWEDVSAHRRMTETANAVAEDLAAASGRLAKVAGSLEEQAQATAQGAVTAAAAVEQMSASVQEIAGNTTTAATVAADAVQAANGVSASINKLESSSREIGQVLELITSVAKQTNLLALNATIEAARAGHAGRGFAVVAQEVKDLAQQAAEATTRIGAMIESLQGDSAEATASIASITAFIGQISDRQTSIAGAVEQQSSTTNEIGRSVADVAATAQHTRDDITQMTTAIANIADKASQLRQLVDETSARDPR